MALSVMAGPSRLLSRPSKSSTDRLCHFGDAQEATEFKNRRPSRPPRIKSGDAHGGREHYA